MQKNYVQLLKLQLCLFITFLMHNGTPSFRSKIVKNLFGRKICDYWTDAETAKVQTP